MKYILILSLITLATFASGKPLVEGGESFDDIEILLGDILTVLKDPMNGYSFTLLKVNSLQKDKNIGGKYNIEADLKVENGERQSCSGVIRPFISDVNFYDFKFWCPIGVYMDSRAIA